MNRMQTVRYARMPLAAIAILTLSACSDGGSDAHKGDDSGPCVHEYLDEVLHLESAAGRDTDAVIAQVWLSEFRLDGEAVEAAALISGRATNLEADGDRLQCTLPCSFGVAEGSWEFTAEAPGYAATPQIVEAAYATFDAGCPSASDDGTVVSILLDESD